MTMSRAVILAITILILSFDIAEAQQQVPATLADKSPTKNYDPSLGQLSLQFGTGVLFGLGSGAIGSVTSAAIFESPNNESAGLSNLGYFAVGSVPYVVGSAYGIFLVANSGTNRASFSKILVGNVIGAGVGAGIMLFSGSVLGDRNFVASGSLALLTTVVGGVIANKKSIIRGSATSSALLNVQNDNTSLSSPSIQLTQVGNYDLPRNRAATVKLLNISL